MEPRGLDFVGVTVADLDRAVAFYRDTLGLPLTFREDAWGYAELDLPPATVALFVAPPEALPPPGGGGITMAVAVADVVAATAEVRAKGVPVLVEAMETSTCVMTLIADPDGNRLWLHQRKDGTAG